MNRVQISTLLDVYGSLLPEKQKLMLELYCDEDFSLAEISEHIGITRQGVGDAIRRASQFLMDTENKLKIYETNKAVAKYATKIKNSEAGSEITDAALEILNLIYDR